MRIDRKKFEEKWTVKNAPLLMAEMLYFGDTEKRRKLLGHEFGGHIFLSQNEELVFYQNKYIARQIQRIGTIKYKNSKYLKRFFALTRRIEKKILQISRAMNKDLGKKSAKELFNLFDRFFNVYSELQGIYRFTRPDVYEGLIKKLKKGLPAPQEKNLLLLLKNEFSKIGFVLSKKKMNLFVNLKKIGDSRYRMHELYLDGFLAAHNLFRAIAQEANYTIKEIRNCTYQEIKDLLLFNIKPDRSVLKRRIKGYMLIYHKNYYKLDTLGKFKSILAQEKPRQLKGRPAFPGQVTGRVKIFTHLIGKTITKEMNQMKKGDILVSVSTSPDLIPAIHKAGAIVTDIGGALSHAAIVSRELKIPCVIDTKFATRVLRDGDRVKVDANKGIIKKI